MPTVRISESPLSGRPGPTSVYYRNAGAGPPLLYLHGGWGYEVHSFDRQIPALSTQQTVISPDRTGYGRSGRISNLPPDFHAQAAAETSTLIDALNLDRPILWGHSDGAVIAVMMALATPSKYRALILEAFHFYRVKPGSREFFETMINNPEMLGDRVTGILARDHGEDYWRRIIELNGRAWLRIADDSLSPNQDLYDGRLRDVSLPVLFIHGKNDPRTEPGELDAVSLALPGASWALIEEGGHSPHSKRNVSEECGLAAARFLAELPGAGL